MANQYSQSHFLSDDLEQALAVTSANVRAGIEGEIDLLFAFSAGYSPEDFDRHLPKLKLLTGAKVVLGCTSETAAGGSYELENAPALSLWAARMPGAEILPMHLSYARSSTESAIVGWPETTDGDWPEDSSLIVLGEPFGFPVDVLLERFNEDRPGVRIAGGMASGASAPGESRLLLGEQTFEQGLVAIRISGTPVRMLVSQGCRPIGDPMVITKCERNIIQSLGGKKALDVVYELFQTLPTREQRMFQSGLHLGRVIDEYQEKFEFGDFLIRNVIGIDKEESSIQIGDFVRPGQTVQFHIRDAESASIELEQLLKRVVGQRGFEAALLFSCNGRGTNLFPDPHHDVSKIQNANRTLGAKPDSERLAKTSTETVFSADDTVVETVSGVPDIPLAGFFAAGEIGPVGNKNFLHGFTASLVLFE